MPRSHGTALRFIGTVNSRADADFVPFNAGTTAFTMVLSDYLQDTSGAPATMATDWSSAVGSMMLRRGNNTRRDWFVRPSSGQTNMPITVSGASVWCTFVLVWTGTSMYAWCNTLGPFMQSAGGTWGTGTPPWGLGDKPSGSVVAPNAYVRDVAYWNNLAILDDRAPALAQRRLHPLQLGPDHWWPMDGTDRDLVGGNPMTRFADATFDAAPAGLRYIPEGGDAINVITSPGAPPVTGDVPIRVAAQQRILGHAA